MYVYTFILSRGFADIYQSGIVNLRALYLYEYSVRILRNTAFLRNIPASVRTCNRKLLRDQLMVLAYSAFTLLFRCNGSVRLQG